MATSVRLGVQVPPADPFWVQMREAIVQYAEAMRIDVISFDLEALAPESAEQETTALELIQALELDTIISHQLPTSLLQRVLKVDIPVIYLNEHTLRHPRFVTTIGLHESAQIAVRYMAEQLEYHGNALLVGEFETGHSRLAGACGVLQAFPRIVQYRQPCPWNYHEASARLSDALQRIDAPLDGIFGFSDGLALVARDIGRALGVVCDDTVVVGIDGDPLAIAAIAEGSMAATVELAPIELGRQAVELAYQAAHRLPVPRHCCYQPRLVTRQNVADVAAKKLIALAHMPSRLVGVNRQQERQQLAQLEASQLINRQASAILNRAALVREIVKLIRTHFGYDEVYLLRWSHQYGTLTYDQQAHSQQLGSAGIEASGVLAEAIGRNEAIFVPDMHRSQRFTSDQAWPTTISRVVVPIHVGANIIGLLDLHSTTSRPHTRQELSGLQSLADQLGTALRNAELYEDALSARAAAERADTLKTRLLANVSHELRTPLNVILGYTQTILSQPQIYAEQLPANLLNDVRHVYQSGEHLIRLINDLLDLSRAEIGALDIFPELLDPRALLAEAFESMAARQPEGSMVRWQLDLSAQLPLLEADPVRVRQIMFNLLSNAAKFTTRGQITLGARIEPPCLRIWVADTGDGIPRELHERIFEPFVTGEQPGGAREGIGLGLSIVRQLVALHGGTMQLESQPGHGSVFHVALPLPRIHADASRAHLPRPPAVLLVATSANDHMLSGLCRRQKLLPYYVAADEQLDRLFTAVQPVALVCDVDQARVHDWSLIEQIRLHPQGCMVPLLLYNPLEAATDGAWLTRVLVKPFRSTQLLDIVMATHSEADPSSVLIVDDDPESCAFYQQLVASVLPAASVRVALGGAAALALLAHEVPSLLILDLVMPGVDGFAVLQHLRADTRTRNLPVMVLSGKVLSPEDLRRLTYHQVVYQSKDMLTVDELAGQIRRAERGVLTRSPQTSRLVKHAVAYLQTHHQRRISRQEIADALGINQTYLSEIFQQELGLSPWDYLNRYRIKQAKSLLCDSSRSITEVAGSVGFNDPSYFGRVFRRIVGCSPQEYRGRPGSGE